jgi:acetyl esterase/lipase
MSEPSRRLSYGDAPSCFVDLWLPGTGNGGGDVPVVALLHGGYWRARHDLRYLDPVAADLAERGWVAANVEYRRVGEPGGGAPGTFDDVLAALTVLRPAAVIGHSAGGHLALWAAPLLQPAPVVVALAPVADLADAHRRGLSHGAVAELLGSAEPSDAELAAWMPAQPVSPTLLVHGTEDTDVPIELTHRLRERWGPHVHDRGSDSTVTYLEVGGADHFALTSPKHPAWGSVYGWLRTVLSPRSSTAPTRSLRSPIASSPSRRD